MTITIVLEIILILYGCMVLLTGGYVMHSNLMMMSGALFILTGIFESCWIGATIPCVIAALVCLALSC